MRAALGFGVGGLRAQPQGSALFDDLRMLTPALGNLAGQRVAAALPADSGGQLTPELGSGLKAKIAPAPGSWRAAGTPGGKFELGEALDQFDRGAGVPAGAARTSPSITCLMSSG